MSAIIERKGALAPLSVDDTELQAQLYACPVRGRGQKHRVYFNLFGEEPVTDGSHPDEVSKVSYLVLDGDKALFLGMALHKRLRGRGLGGHMIRYFMAHAQSQDLEVVGTARINKPMIGLTPQRQGFQPASDACRVEILPAEEDQLLIPTVRFLNNDLPESEIRDSFPGGKFYYVAEPASVGDRPVDPGKVVALHLPYAPPAQ